MRIQINTATVKTAHNETIVWVAEIVRSGFGPARVELFRNGQDWGVHALSLIEIQTAVGYCTPSNRLRRSIAKRLVAE